MMDEKRGGKGQRGEEGLLTGQVAGSQDSEMTKGFLSLQFNNVLVCVWDRAHSAL